jgi:hypothetical protein
MVFKTILMDSPGAHAFAPSLANAKLASGVKPVMPTFTFGEPPPGPLTVPTTSSKEISPSGDVSEYVKKSNPSCEMAPLTRLFVAVITKLKVPAVREISPVIVPPSKSHGLLMQVSMINGIAEACAGKKANKPSVKATGGSVFTDSSLKMQIQQCSCRNRESLLPYMVSRRKQTTLRITESVRLILPGPPNVKRADALVGSVGRKI